MKKVGSVVSMLFIIALYLALQTPPSFALDMPSKVSQAVSVSHQWLETFEGKAPEAVTKQLGEPKTKKTWDFQGKDWPLWEYEVKEHNGTLLLFFFEGAVINISLQLQNG